jgi:tetratricopeptide (TPR) repeat protein
MGLHLFAAWLLVRLTAAKPTRAFSVAGVLVAVLVMLSVMHGRVFRSEEALWQDVLAKSPGQPQAALQLASLYMDRKAFDDAERVMRETLAAQPDNEPLRLRLGLLYMQLKRYENAVAQFQEAINRGTKNPLAYYNSGLAQVELGRGKDALRYLETVIQGEKLPGKYYYVLGRAYHQAGQLEDALEQLRLAVKKDPNHAQAYNQMGKVYWDMKTYFFADAAFQKAYQADNTSIPILNNLISSSMLMRQYDDAIRYCDRLLEVDPDNANARQWRIAAQRLKETGKKEPVTPQTETPAAAP